jgi:AbrB family looped-hinge helix DNA binding protein
MRFTSKGRVTIPADIRARAGLMPNTEVAFKYDGTAVRIVPLATSRKPSRGDALIAHLRGRAKTTMTSEQIVALTRGEEPRARQCLLSLSTATCWSTYSPKTPNGLPGPPPPSPPPRTAPVSSSTPPSMPKSPSPSPAIEDLEAALPRNLLHREPISESAAPPARFLHRRPRRHCRLPPPHS